MNEQDVTFDSGGCTLGYRRAVRDPVSPDVLDILTSWVTRTLGRS